MLTVAGLKLSLCAGGFLSLQTCLHETTSVAPLKSRTMFCIVTAVFYKTIKVFILLLARSDRKLIGLV